MGSEGLRPGLTTKPIKPIEITSAKESYTLLQARQPAVQELVVKLGAGTECGEIPLWTGYVPLAQEGTSYEIPIPKAEFFGKQVFAATFDDSGALSLIQYAKDTGVAPALTTLQSTLSAADTTTAEKTASLKAEADLIAAQQRVVKCKATPAECK